MKRSKRHKRCKVAKWKKIFYFTKPTAATGEVWERWRRHVKARYPILYFLRERLPTFFRVKKLQFSDFIWWFKYRTTDRNHILKIRNLKPGYYEPDTKMLYAAFSLLIDHVEIGLACRNFGWYEKKYPKWLPTIFRRFWKQKINPQAGIDHLIWEMTDEDVVTNSPEQSRVAGIIMRLYVWWTQERQERIDAHSDFRIWEGVEREHCDLFFGSGRNPKYKAALDSMSKLNDFYDAQDQAMLIKLVEIRNHLWS